MRILFAILMLLSVTAHAYDPADYVCSGSDDYCVSKNGPKEPVVIFMNHGKDVVPCPEDEWCLLDLSEHVPFDAVAADLSGTILISTGFASELCDIRLFFRRPGAEVDRRMWQTIAHADLVGSRTNGQALVPILDQFIEYKWWRSTPGKHPQHCNYGINVSLQGFIR